MNRIKCLSESAFIDFVELQLTGIDEQDMSRAEKMISKALKAFRDAKHVEMRLREQYLSYDDKTPSKDE